MIKRARIWLLIALVGGFFGFTGVLHSTAVIPQALFYVCSAFAILSILFSLFEEQGEPNSLDQETIVPLHNLVRQQHPANPEPAPTAVEAQRLAA